MATFWYNRECLHIDNVLTEYSTVHYVLQLKKNENRTSNTSNGSRYIKEVSYLLPYLEHNILSRLKIRINTFLGKQWILKSVVSIQLK